MQAYRTNPPSRAIAPHTAFAPSARYEMRRAPRVVQAHTNMAAASAAIAARIGGEA